MRRGFNVLSYAFYMSISITELQLDEVNTISIPTDAILIVSLLIVFALLGYFLNNILDNQKNKLVQKTDDDSNLELIKEKLEDQLTLDSSTLDQKNLEKPNLELVKEKLEDQLTLDSSTLDQKNLEKPNIKKLNFLPPSKLLGLGSLAVVAIGGASLLGFQTLQKSYKGVNTNQVSIKPKNQSTKSLLSMVEMQASEEAQTKIKKTSYINPFLSTINNARYNTFDQLKASETERYFYF